MVFRCASVRSVYVPNGPCSVEWATPWFGADGLNMRIKPQKPAKIITTLAQVEVLIKQRKARFDVYRQNSDIEQTYYHSRNQYGGM